MNTLSTSSITQHNTALPANRVLRNTYWLLSMTLLFSAVTAGISSALSLPHPGLLLTLVGYFGLLYLTTRFRNSALGLVMVFALTGFMGYTIGPLLNAYLAMSNGPQLVMMALGATAITFLALSGYALISRRDFSFMSSFLLTGIIVGFLAGIGAYVFSVPGLSPRSCPPPLNRGSSCVPSRT